jgi:Xaa-Pro aminopeptidase
MSESEVAARRDRLAMALRQRHADAYLSASPADIRYFTGSDEVRGFVMVSADAEAELIVPPLVELAVRASTEGIAIFVGSIDGNLDELLAKRLESRRVGRLLTGRLEAPTSRTIHSILANEVLDGTPVANALRREKSEGEKALLRSAAAICDIGLAAAFEGIRPGASELSVVASAEAAIRLAGAEATGFPTSFGSGPRSVFPSAQPTERALEIGDMGFLDIGPLHRGYHADATRSFVLGPPTADQKALLGAVQAALDRAITSIRPGLPAEGVYTIVVDTIAGAGFPRLLPHYAGHGLGLFGGEPPWLVPGNADPIRGGDFLAIEPGIYAPGLGGARLEQDVLVHEDGCELLTLFPVGPFVGA